MLEFTKHLGLNSLRKSKCLFFLGQDSLPGEQFWASDRFKITGLLGEQLPTQLTRYLPPCNASNVEYFKSVSSHGLMSHITVRHDNPLMLASLEAKLHLLYRHCWYVLSSLLKFYRCFFLANRDQERLLIVQCEDGNRNSQLIACASYCIIDERVQMESTQPTKLAHVVFIINLARMSSGFTAFPGMWPNS